MNGATQETSMISKNLTYFCRLCDKPVAMLVLGWRQGVECSTILQGSDGGGSDLAGPERDEWSRKTYRTDAASARACPEDGT